MSQSHISNSIQIHKRSQKKLQNQTNEKLLKALPEEFAKSLAKTLNEGTTPYLENILYIYARSHDYSISVGKIGKLECDFILRDVDLNYLYVQVAYSILRSQETLDREFKPLESVKDNYPKYIMTLDYLFQKRNGIKHVNILDFIKENSEFN